MGRKFDETRVEITALAERSSLTELPAATGEIHGVRDVAQRFLSRASFTGLLAIYALVKAADTGKPLKTTALGDKVSAFEGDYAVAFLQGAQLAGVFTAEYDQDGWHVSEVVEPLRSHTRTRIYTAADHLDQSSPAGDGPSLVSYANTWPMAIDAHFSTAPASA